MKQRIQVLIENMPLPHKEGEKPKLTIEDRVRDACEMVESGHESAMEWEFLRKINNLLMKKPKLSKRQETILKLVQPTLQKHMRHTSSEVLQDADRLSEIEEL